MINWTGLAFLVALCLHPGSGIKFANGFAVTTEADSPALADKVPSQPATVPKGASKEWLHEKWKKYGQWDYKQRAFVYREFTQFNFGATGAAGGVDLKSLTDLEKSAKPTRDDVKAMDDSELVANFYRNIDSLYKLHEMSEEDAHLVRIAADYTWLDNSSEWPRSDIGLAASRWNDYRALFERVRLQEGIVRVDDFPGAIFFIAHAKGLCTGGSSVGYVFSLSPLTPTTQSPSKDLDAEARANPSRHYAYVFQDLKTNWYAFYEIDW